MPLQSTSHATQGVLLIAAFLDMSLFGLVCQQCYTYWITGFKDPIYLKLFVNVQFTLVTFQNIMIWHLTFKFFIDYPGQLPPGATLWSGPANSICQLFIVILANIFLASRIHGLSKSITQCIVPIALSFLAFVFGIVTIVTSTWFPHSHGFRYGMSVVWYASQAMAECLITFYLVLALLKTRSGIKRSDVIVRHLVRNVIQTGVLAAIWAIASLASWFFVDRILIYRLFDITSGTVYTYAIFETLISRNQLRGRMAISNFVDLGNSTQVEASERFHGIEHYAPEQPNNSRTMPGTTLTNKHDILEMYRVSTPDEPYAL